MLQIHPIPAFKDNYFWLIQPDSATPDAYIVDPGDAAPVLTALQEKNLQLKGILITHHHHDHIDGATRLHDLFNIPINGPQSPRIPQITHILNQGDSLTVGAESCQIINLPGHTLDHIAYYFQPADSAPLLFSGDTLFAAGCGRLFDGTAPLLFAALQKIAALPTNTIIYAAHEYTLSNIEFALYIEPNNQALQARKAIESAKRAAGIPTLPTTLDIELRTNPFLRCHLESVAQRAEALAGTPLLSPLDVFTVLRQAKDQF